MARIIKDVALETRAARERLKPRGKPYYRIIEEGLHLGYRKPRSGAGKWVLRHYVGGQSYTVETLAPADDLSDADGIAILSYRQAQAAARERLVKRARVDSGKRGPLTVKDVVEHYLGWLGENRRSAVDARCRAQAHIFPTLGPIEVETLTAERLRRWLGDLARSQARLRTRTGAKQNHRAHPQDHDGKRRRRASANRTLTILKAALNRAWREGRISSDAAWRRVEPFENVDAARIRYLRLAEAQRLINACDPHFRPLVEGALHTGARYGELTRLQVHDFNPDAGTVAIRVSKSGKARHVVLTEEGQALFTRLAMGREGSVPIFTRPDGEPWAPSNQIRRMAEASKRAKITPAVNFHALRHTWASLAVMAGAPLLVAARNLGHADTRMCEKHYSHLAPSFIADTIRATAPRFGTTASSENVRTLPVRGSA